MSWQATAWAQLQKTGNPARKALLLVIANYADEYGCCWPSQKTLATGCEMSVDTVQRHTRVLRNLGMLTIEKREIRRGRWPVWHYTLNMKITASRELNSAAELNSVSTGPQFAAQSKVPKVPKNGATEPQPGRRPGRNQDADRAAQLCGLNSNTNIQENLHGAQQPLNHAEAHKATKRSRRDIQDLQRAVVSKLGNGDVEAGWLLFGSLETWQRKQLENLEAEGALDRARVDAVQAARVRA